MSGMYYVTVGTDTTCTATDSVYVTVNAAPIAKINPVDTTICIGQYAKLVASGDGIYSWSTGHEARIIYVHPTSTTTYTLTVTNEGCSDTASATVHVLPVPRATASVNPNPVCQDETAWFTAEGGVSYSWSGPGGFSIDRKEFGRKMTDISYGGIYTVTVTNSAGCTATATVNVTVKPGIVASLSVTPNPACSGQTVQFTATGGTRYDWKGPQGFTSTLANPVIRNAQQYHSGTYIVAISNATGCSKTLTVDLTVNQSPAGTISYDAKSTCTGSTLQLHASGGSSYVWSGPAGFSSVFD